MQILEIAFTGYSVTDMDRARKFYEGVLGLKKTRSFGQIDGDGQWAEYDIGAGCLALITGGGSLWPPSSAGTAAALEVDDLDGYAKAVEQHGVKIIFPVRETPSCRMMVIADPDGNWIALHQRKITVPA